MATILRLRMQLAATARSRPGLLAGGLLLCAMAWLAVWVRGATDQAPPGSGRRHVLILHSYHQGYPFTDEQAAGIREALEAVRGVETHVVYMDAKRVSPADYEPILKEGLKIRLGKVPLSGVLVTDNDALHFAVSNRQEFFASIPVVFSGINEFDEAMLAGQTNIAGVVEDSDYAETLDAALRLRPGLRRIAAVTDPTTTGMLHERAVLELEERYRGRLALEVLSLKDYTMEEFLRQLRGLEPDSAVLLLHHYQDKGGRSFSHAASMDLIQQACPAPIFIVNDTRLRPGVVGGKIIRGTAHGKAAARALLQLMDGKRPATGPVLRSPNAWMFDYSGLRRWSMAESSLPAGSVVVGRPESPWAKYGETLSSTAAVAVLLIGAIAILAVNVARRKRVEAALRVTNQRLTAIFENARDAIIIADASNGQIIDLNSQAAKLLKRAREELIGKPQTLLHPEDQAERYREMFQAHVAGRGCDPIEAEIVAGDKRRVPVEIASSLIELGPKTRLLQGIFRDISERKRAEETVRDSESRYRLLVENQNDLIVKFDTSHRLTFASPSYCRAFGISEDQALNRDFLLPVHEEDREAVRRSLERLAAPAHTAVHEERAITVHGLRWFEWSDKAVLDERGEVREIIAVGRDITERKQLTEQLRQAVKMEAVGHLAGGVAHDFNNLLTVVLGHLDLMSSHAASSPSIRESLREIRSASERAGELTRQLLTFGRRQSLRITQIDLCQVVDNLLRMLRRLIGEHITVATSSSQAELLIDADAGMIEQVIINMAINARDAMPHGGRLTIGMSLVEIDANQARTQPDASPGRKACLSIADTGQGMDAPTLKRIFEPFFTTKEVGKGTGLGLATAYGIVKQHKGWIEVRSTPGHGTTFKIFLPTSRQIVSFGPSLPSFLPTLPSTERHTILLVEDDELLRGLLSRFLEQKNQQVFDAPTGEQALKVWERHRTEIKLLIADMVMPGGMTGYDLACRCRQQKPDLPVIIISGYSAEAALSIRAARPPMHFLPKPFNTNALTSLIHQCLGNGQTL